MVTINEHDLLEKWRKLEPNDQQIVIDLMRRLSRPIGEPGDRLLQHAREINFPKEDLAEMAAAIAELENDAEDDEDIVDGLTVQSW
jgi:hypothetical protein